MERGGGSWGGVVRVLGFGGMRIGGSRVSSSVRSWVWRVGWRESSHVR